jgi:choline-sulfatase
MPAPAGLTDPVQIAYWQEQRAVYADLIRLVDHEMGLILTALEQRGLLDNTLVIHCSDHGDRIGDTGSWHKGQPEDGSVRTPWFMRLPGVIPAGVEHDAVAESVDLPATILAAAGVTTPAHEVLPDSPGENWWPHCTQTTATTPRSVQYAECKTWRMIADQEWKYISHHGDQRERLHHRSTDPDDLVNLIDHPQHQDVAHRLRYELIQRISSTPAANTEAFVTERAERAREALANPQPRPSKLPQIPTGPLAHLAR